jgi:hypothetical protein
MLKDEINIPTFNMELYLSPSVVSEMKHLDTHDLVPMRSFYVLREVNKEIYISGLSVADANSLTCVDIRALLGYLSCLDRSDFAP